MIGRSAQEANEILTAQGLYMKIVGAEGAEHTIVAVRQTPAAGTAAEPGTVVSVEFSDLSAQD